MSDPIDSVELSKPADRMMLTCHRCHKAMLEGDEFCCSWAAYMYEEYFALRGF